MKTTRVAIPLGLAAGLAALLAWLWWGWEPAPSPGGLPRGGDFTLTSARGPVSLADFRGKAVLIYFGYTWCPDVCPTNLALLAIALRQLTPEERPRVQVLFVSVDPQRDTPLRLAQYTAYFHPGMIGLTGDSEQVARVAAQYGAVYHRVETPDSAAGYLVDHSSHTYLVGPGGRLRRVLGHATPPAQTLRALREVLREGA